MKGPTNTRHLAANEIAIARTVFNDTIPYDQVLVSDGLGGGDRPFTVPTSLPMNFPTFPNFNVRGGRYVIHAGDGYYGMSTAKADKELLIHELTHVWQGENETSWSWAYVIFSLKDQALSDDAYAYDHERYKPWRDYGPEQQAQIVEDWYAEGMKSFDPLSQTGDRRFYYIKKHIRHEPVDGDWTIVPLRRIEPGKLNIKPYFPDSLAAFFLPILETRVRAGDRVGIATRVRKLEEGFQSLSPESARELESRLVAKRRDDKLAHSFDYRLAPPTQHRLLHMLRVRGSGR